MASHKAVLPTRELKNSVLSDIPSHKVGSTPSSSVNAIYDMPHEHVVQIFMVSSFATFHPFFQPTLRDL